MIEKKKTPGSAATLTGAGQMETAAFGEAAISCSHDTTTPARRQVPRLAIADLLDTGERNGKTLKELREILNGDGRTIRARIEQERRSSPILSGQSGYYLPACEDEIRRFCGSMRRRARAILTSAANVEKAAGLSKCNPQLEGQLTIDSGGDESA